ncbi:MAG TPA: NmrA family NAD(P)-binding protein [Gemmatimonadota bacterium]|nr:NmrA family NAD(P)-binding protein [Gemmatimonadota bacterium]
MRILVIGGTGKVGSALVEELARRDVGVRVMSRSGGPTGRPGVEGVRGDMSRPDTLAAAFAGVDRCYLLTPLAQDETELGLNALDAARAARVERIVFQSVSHADDYPMIPHFASKVRILDEIRDSGLPWAAVFPSSFYQNDVALRDLILGPGIYPNPIGSGGINRVDVRDIAAVAAAALLEPGLESSEVPAVGPGTWTGDSIAAVYSDLLGREVRYPGDDLEAWAAGARNFLPEWLVHDLAIMFEQFQDAGLSASPEELAETRELLGREPRAFEEFARDLVAGA